MSQEEPTTPEVAVEQNPLEEVFEESKELKALYEEMESEQEEEEPPEDIDESKEESAVEEEEPNEEEEEDLSEYSKNVQKRIGDLTKKRRDVEREKERIDKENAELKARLAEFESGSTKKQLQEELPEEMVPPVAEKQPDPSNKLVELKNKVRELRQERVKAEEEFDYAKKEELNEQIDEIRDQIIEEKLKVSQETYKDNAAKNAHKEAMSIASNEFVARNSWFKVKNDDGTDNIHFDKKKSDYAVKVGAYLANNFDGTPTEYFKAIENDVNEMFQPKQKYPGIAAVNPNKQTNQTETMALNEVEKEVAYGAFPNLSKRDAEKEYIKIAKNQKRSA